MSGDIRTDRDTLADRIMAALRASDDPDAVPKLVDQAHEMGRAEGRAEVTATVETVCAEADWLDDDTPPRSFVPADVLRAALADPGQALAAHDAQMKAEAYRKGWRDANQAEAGGPDDA